MAQILLDWLTLLAHIATAAGVLFVWQQLKVAKEEARLSRQALEISKNTMVDDHKRSRRQFAIEVTREWNRSVKPATSAARRLIASLSSEQCKSIAKPEPVPVQIDAKHEYLVEICLGKKAGRGLEGEKLSLDAADVQQLRYLGVDFLNEIEIPLSAWHQNIGDEKYLELEFGSISDAVAMSSFRKELGETYRYPALEEFLRWKKRKQENPKPEQLGSSQRGTAPPV